MGKTDFEGFFFADRVNKHTLARIQERINPGGFKPNGYITEPKCPICNHILRPQIEEMIYAGIQPNLINEFIMEMGYSDFNTPQLKKHATDHCPVLTASRELAKMKHESKVEELSQELLSGSEALNIIINTFREKVEAGEEIKVTAGNVIKAVETKTKIEGSVPLLDIMAKLFENKEAEMFVEGEVVEEAEFEVSGGPDQPAKVEKEEEYEFFKEEVG
jgi:hypothetical protein